MQFTKIKWVVGTLLLAATLGGMAYSYKIWLGASSVGNTGGANKQKPGLNLGLQNVRDYFEPDMALEDIRWEAFGTPDWAPDRMEMWPTDYVSLILTGRVSPNAIAEKFSGHAKPHVAAPDNAVRPWLSAPMKVLMQGIVDHNKVPSNIKCRELPPQAQGKYESGFACTDGEQVLYFLLLQSLTN